MQHAGRRGRIVGQAKGDAVLKASEDAQLANNKVTGRSIRQWPRRRLAAARGKHDGQDRNHDGDKEEGVVQKEAQ